MELRHGTTVATVDLVHGGRLGSLLVGGHEVVVGRNDVGTFFWGSYPMAPWVGRTLGARFAFEGAEYRLPVNTETHAMHGTVYDRPWVEEDAGVIACDLGPDWPFPGVARQRFDLGADHLTMSLEVEAIEVPMPAAVGWHPWFPRTLGGAELEVDFEADAMEVRTDTGIERVPPAPPPWDQCFDGVRWPVVLTWPGVLRLSVWSDCPKAVMYDRHHLGVCVEPQTDRPDALNLDPHVVVPGVPLVATMRWTWELP